MHYFPKLTPSAWPRTGIPIGDAASMTLAIICAPPRGMQRSTKPDLIMQERILRNNINDTDMAYIQLHFCRSYLRGYNWTIIDYSLPSFEYAIYVATPTKQGQRAFG